LIDSVKTINATILSTTVDYGQRSVFVVYVESKEMYSIILRTVNIN
jgi:hypothetical protein